MDSFLNTYGTHKVKQEWHVLFAVSCIVCYSFPLQCPSPMLSSNTGCVFTQFCFLRVKYMWRNIYHCNHFEIYGSPGILWTSPRCISRTLSILTTETAYPLLHDSLPSPPTNQSLLIFLSLWCYYYGYFM